MSRQPKILTNGWLEVKGSLEQTGFFRDDQLNPGIAPRILADLVRRYTTIIAYGADGRSNPLGSGTLLRRTDGQYGILTAGHVIGAIRNKEDILVLPAQDREEVAWIRIEREGMHGSGESKDTTQGPDIGWIPLSAEEARRMESLGAVFRNRQDISRISRAKYARLASFSDLWQPRAARRTIRLSHMQCL